ncbi:hypothetical protein B0G62_102150 [Paraburkholderia eburnea]|uniref:Uncharacterized protein n=1 Tax=Paraburkholderia eburnea TaxID=1189126 RepID=A0A2S4MII3_9BURK|nr:hypothetical protein [Paraburkholderia eburnea]POR54542.1 hypothetical protein B0G62_102150 [Paraburkholderia eburnea]PRZ19757.1 hypothetical protein BX588_114150 [Paraburkholderia eburnea]
MIPDIGVMIGLYIITRMVALISKPESKTFSRIMAWITIGVTIISVIDLFSKASSISPGRL